MIENNDAVLWYNVGRFGEYGYAVPNFSDDYGTLNHNIAEFVDLVGQQLFAIMHVPDGALRRPPTINTLRKIHKMYLRASQLLAGRAVPANELDFEPQHTMPGGAIFKVYPVPYFRMRNPYLKSWGGYILMCLAEAMQHTENAKPVEISTDFAGDVGQYIRRVYQLMSAEMFGKSRDEVRDPAFLLSDEDLNSYDPSRFFTRTEMVDTVAPFNRRFTEDRLDVLREGIPVTELPKLTPWPHNVFDVYERLRPKGETPAAKAEVEGGGKGQSGGAVRAIIPPAPTP